MDDKILYSGIAVGGPLDGKTVEGRFSDGIVFVSKPDNKAWIYDYFEEDRRFYARPLGYDLFWDDFTTGQKLEVIRDTVLSGIDPTRELDMEQLSTAAEGSTYEVRALPEEVSV